MSDLTIKDGTGTGTRAKVSADHRLHVKANGSSEEAFASEQGQFFIFSSLENIVLSVNNEIHVLWFQNKNPDKVFRIHEVIISHNGGNSSGLAVLTVRLRTGSTEPSANNDLISGKNFNLSNAAEPISTAYAWDGTSTGMTIATPGNVFLSRYCRQGTTEMVYDGSLIMGYNNVLDLSVEGQVEDHIASIYVTGWFESLED